MSSRFEFGSTDALKATRDENDNLRTQIDNLTKSNEKIQSQLKARIAQSVQDHQTLTDTGDACNTAKAQIEEKDKIIARFEQIKDTQTKQVRGVEKKLTRLEKELKEARAECNKADERHDRDVDFWRKKYENNTSPRLIDTRHAGTKVVAEHIEDLEDAIDLWKEVSEGTQYDVDELMSMLSEKDEKLANYTQPISLHIAYKKSGQPALDEQLDTIIGHQHTITTLEETITSLQTNITSLQTKITSLRTKITTLENTITSLQTRTTSQEDVMAGQEEFITGQDEIIAVQLGNITDLRKERTDLMAKLEHLMSMIGKQMPRRQDISKKLPQYSPSSARAASIPYTSKIPRPAIKGPPRPIGQELSELGIQSGDEQFKSEDEKVDVSPQEAQVGEDQYEQEPESADVTITIKPETADIGVQAGGDKPQMKDSEAQYDEDLAEKKPETADIGVQAGGNKPEMKDSETQYDEAFAPKKPEMADIGVQTGFKKPEMKDSGTQYDEAFAPKKPETADIGVQVEGDKPKMRDSGVQVGKVIPEKKPQLKGVPANSKPELSDMITSISVKKSWSAHPTAAIILLVLSTLAVLLWAWNQCNLATKERNMWMAANDTAYRLGDEVIRKQAIALLQSVPKRDGLGWLTPEKVMSLHRPTLARPFVPVYTMPLPHL